MVRPAGISSKLGSLFLLNCPRRSVEIPSTCGSAIPLTAPAIGARFEVLLTPKADRGSHAAF
jgi:hypothetical protein